MLACVWAARRLVSTLMDIPHITAPLNPQQKEAVVSEASNMLVLAGAGSGKTMVLVHRIAWQIENRGVLPFAIFAVTFTNKAASEMRGRIENLLGQSVRGMWVGTFHGLAHRMLRLHWRECGLPETFQILDSDDQFRMLRRTIRAMQLDDRVFAPREMQQRINGWKDQTQRPADIASSDDKTVYARRIYENYQAECDAAGVVDFSELLLRSWELLNANPAVLEHYQQRFSHILVDEFQDTNDLQYQWLRLLAGSGASVFAVGDDDQSIYSWRGARMDHMQLFERDFPDVQLVRLEQNYRSTKTILDAANALIRNNHNRLGKELHTASETGEAICLYQAMDEQGEASHVGASILAGRKQGRNWGEHAVLYRTSAQSRVFEEAMIQSGIPYRVYGGMRFYERAEIKHAIAYMRLALSPDDDVSLERVINTPRRGIGQQTLSRLRAHAGEQQCSLWQASERMLQQEQFASRTRAAVETFRALILQMRAACRERDALVLHEFTQQIIEWSGLREHYLQDGGQDARSRIENLEELVSAARAFVRPEEDTEEAQQDELSAFLAHAALESGETQSHDDSSDYVHLMTLHKVKGLEFPVVFLVGLEEELFPHQLSMGDPAQLEEERRLCYVGITRAQQVLHISWAVRRNVYGRQRHPKRSRFVRELPSGLCRLAHRQWGWTQKDEPQQQPWVPQSRRAPRRNGGEDPQVAEALLPGQHVRHHSFGEGMVTALDVSGGMVRVQVHFRDGSKWLSAAHANLQPVGGVSGGSH